MPPLPSRTLSIEIARDWRALYEEFWRPERFGLWAAGLAEAELRPEGDCWRTSGPGGEVTIRFTPHNPFGVMDHVVETAEGTRVEVPLRIVANGDGATVMLTLYRQPGMSDDDFQADARAVMRDLKALRARAAAR